MIMRILVPDISEMHRIEPQKTIKKDGVVQETTFGILCAEWRNYAEYP